MERPSQSKPLRVYERPLHCNRSVICDRSPTGSWSCSSGLSFYHARPIGILWYNEHPQPAICTVRYGHLRQSAFLVWILSHRMLLQCFITRANIRIPSLTHGVPQGLVVGPLLISIWTTSLGQINHLHGILYHCSADNTQPVILLAWPYSLDKNLCLFFRCIFQPR